MIKEIPKERYIFPEKRQQIIKLLINLGELVELVFFGKFILIC